MYLPFKDISVTTGDSKPHYADQKHQFEFDALICSTMSLLLPNNDDIFNDPAGPTYSTLNHDQILLGDTFLFLKLFSSPFVLLQMIFWEYLNHSICSIWVYNSSLDLLWKGEMFGANKTPFGGSSFGTGTLGLEMYWNSIYQNFRIINRAAYKPHFLKIYKKIFRCRRICRAAYKPRSK